MTLEDLGGAESGVRARRFVMQSAPFERRLRRRNPVLGEASEGAIEAPSEVTTECRS